MPDKPPYRPLMMADVAAAPLTGLTHVSTFSGTGGTCLGFRLAGFRTLFANDIDAHARHCYALNFESPIDGRDARFLTADAILERTGLRVGELDVLEGSPPCTAFSTAGKRARGWNEKKEHAGHVQANVEDLFFEWTRLLEGLRPRAFAAENVSGLVKGVAKGYFKDILRRMKAIGYIVEARLLDAQWLGVPQRRARLIFLGFREDLGVQPRFPMPLPYRYSVREALPWLTSARYDPRGQFAPIPEFVDGPSPTIIGSGKQASRNTGHYLVSDGPQSRLQNGANMHSWHPTDEPSPTIVTTPVNIEVQDGAAPHRWLPSHEPSPTIMAGRAVDARWRREEEAVGDRLGAIWDGLKPGEKNARSHGAVKSHPEEPAPAVLARGGISGNAALMHPFERRKFTIAELKRICAFPDDFQLDGPYAKQWARLGNSVPPLMAYAVGVAVRDVLLEIDGRAGIKKIPARKEPARTRRARSAAAQRRA